MSTDPEDKPPGSEEGSDEDDDAGDRPTVAPPFDPIAFAKEVLGGRPSPPPGAVTVASVPDPHEPPAETPTRPAAAPTTSLPPTKRRPTPGGLLSLANARVPSNLPPRNLPPPTPPPRKIESSNNLGAVDREWEELATSPPPPLQQKLIDAMSRQPDSSREPLPSSQRPVVPMPRNATPLQRSMAPIIAGPPSAQEMNDRVSLGDYTGALEIAERLLLATPDDDAVKQTADTCRGVLRQMYTARIGPLDRVPIVMVARDQMRWLTIDHRAGFVLSLVDGVSSLEMILDMCGMAELDALRILSELAQQRIISFR